MNIIYVILELSIMTLLSFILGFASEDGGILLFLSFLISIALGAIPATIAYRKGRNFYLWWPYGWLLFLIALIQSLLIKKARSVATAVMPLTMPAARLPKK